MKLRSQSTAEEDRALALAPIERRGGALQSALYRLVVLLIRPLEQLYLRAGWSADVATLASLLVALGSGIAAALGRLSLAGILYLLAGALDLLDGRIARRTNSASLRGAALDSIVDRFAEGLVIGGLAWSLRSSLGLALCLGFLIASTGVSYARARGEGLGVKIDAGIMNRGPRVALLSLLMIGEGIHDAAQPSLPFLLALGLLTLMTFLTALSRVVLVLRALPGAERPKRPTPSIRRIL